MQGNMHLKKPILFLHSPDMKYPYLYPEDAQDFCILFCYTAYKHFLYIPVYLQEHKTLAETLNDHQKSFL